MMKFPLPTLAEVEAASDAITGDGPGAEATALLAILCRMSSPLRQATTLKVRILRDATSSAQNSGHLAEVRKLLSESATEGLDPEAILLEGAVTSLTVYGLNIGIRIGEARREGLRRRALIEQLLSHYQEGCSGVDSEATRKAVAAVLQWVLGEREQP